MCGGEFSAVEVVQWTVGTVGGGQALVWRAATRRLGRRRQHGGWRGGAARQQAIHTTPVLRRRRGRRNSWKRALRAGCVGCRGCAWLWHVSEGAVQWCCGKCGTRTEVQWRGAERACTQGAHTVVADACRRRNRHGTGALAAPPTQRGTPVSTRVRARVPMPLNLSRCVLAARSHSTVLLVVVGRLRAGAESELSEHPPLCHSPSASHHPPAWRHAHARTRQLSYTRAPASGVQRAGAQQARRGWRRRREEGACGVRYVGGPSSP